MAKNFKEIEGQIEQINEPRFAKDRRVWVLMVKANGSWRAFVSKDGEKIKAQYELLKSKQIAQSINLSVQATNLSASKVRFAEYAYSLLERHSTDDGVLMKAVEVFSNQQQHLQSPMISECADKFLLKQQKRNLAPVTLKDYHFLLKEVKETFDGKRIREITPTMLT